MARPHIPENYGLTTYEYAAAEGANQSVRSSSLHQSTSSQETMFDGETTNNPNDESTRHATPSRTRQDPKKVLYRSRYILFITAVFCAISIASWTFICILNYRPLVRKTYDWGSGPIDYYQPKSEENIEDFKRNEGWYHAARVLQAIATTFNIPIATAVCAHAAVVFTQKSKRSLNLSLTQLVTLANKGWSDIPTLCNVASRQKWKRFGSSFLAFAIILHIHGVLLGPLQQVLVSTGSVQTRTNLQSHNELHDFSRVRGGIGDGDDGVVQMTRNALGTANLDDFQTQLWFTRDYSASSTCNFANQNQATSKRSYNCINPQLRSVSASAAPFFAELPSGFNTGLIRQYLPQIQSVAIAKTITASEFHAQNCSAIPGSYYANYSQVQNRTSVLDTVIWGVQVCMPYNVTSNRIQNSRNRQHLSEMLFMNVTSLNYSAKDTQYMTSSYSKVTLSSSAGYFELPNYMNGGIAGPLLETYPTNYTEAVVEQYYKYAGRSGSGGSTYYDTYEGERLAKLAWDPNFLEEYPNKPPLLTITMALFGKGSFVDILSSKAVPSNTPQNISSSETSCPYLLPFYHLMEPRDRSYRLSPCVGDRDQARFGSQLQEWTTMFSKGDDLLSNMFTAAAFLANKAWWSSLDYQEPFKVYYDQGAEIKKPVIATPALAFLSILQVFFLAALLTLAFIAYRTPKWTPTLDGWALMRIGTETSKQVPLELSSILDEMHQLDQLPGWVGFAPGSVPQRMELGGSDALKRVPRSTKTYGAAV